MVLPGGRYVFNLFSRCGSTTNGPTSKSRIDTPQSHVRLNHGGGAGEIHRANETGSLSLHAATAYLYLRPKRTAYLYMHAATAYLYMQPKRTAYLYMRPKRTAYLYVHAAIAYLYMRPKRTAYLYMHAATATAVLERFAAPYSLGQPRNAFCLLRDNLEVPAAACAGLDP